MPLAYDTSIDPGEGGGDYPPLKPGEYPFKVETAEETTFGTGSKGLKVKLLVGYTNGRDVPCYSNLVYSDKMLWKVKHLLESIGFEYANPPEAFELVGRTGLGKFIVNEKGYFEAKDFLVDAETLTAPKASAKKPGMYDHVKDDAPPF